MKRFLIFFSPNRLRALLAALFAVMALWLSWARVFERYELQTYDWRFSMRPARPVSPDIVHIDIWNDALELFGRWPFDRKYHAALIQALKYAGARAVVFDIEFVESTQTDLYVELLAQRAGNVYFQVGFGNPKNIAGRYEATLMEAPLLPAFERAAKGVGFPNMVADIDGKRRRVMPVIGYKGKEYYHQTFRVLMDYLGVSPDRVTYRPAGYFEFKKGYRVPLDDEGCMIISYAGPWEKTFKHYSYRDVIQSYQALQEKGGDEPALDLRQLRGKICIVGLTSQASHDVYANPLQKVFPGVGTFSNVINAVIQRDFIMRLDRAANLVILFVLCLLMAMVSLRNKPMVSLFYAVSIMVFFVAYVVSLFVHLGVWADLFYPAVTALAVYMAGTVLQIFREIRKRELIEGELRIASQIQKNFLPVTPPEQKGMKLAVFFRPAKAVGGDLYAFIPAGTDKVGVMVGDVSGKGMPAALFMAKTAAEFKFSARDNPNTAEVLGKLNDSIASESTGGLFVTLTYAIFDLAAMRMTISSAGHLPVVVARPDGRTELLEADGGMPIGVLPEAPFANSEFVLAPGECYAFYSDGISEARNRKKDEFGVEALQKAMAVSRGTDARRILEEAVAAVTRFIGKAEQHDDMTLIIVQIVQGTEL